MMKMALSMVDESSNSATYSDMSAIYSELSRLKSDNQKINYLENIVGSLSSPSKMPCYSYSIPAIYCKTGSRLRKIKGSTCASCYALKGRYIFPNVLNAMKKRFNSLANLDIWKNAMIELIKLKYYSGKKKSFDIKYFRWHDSGDIQSIDHLKAINDIAIALPYIKFWLPTREYAIVQAFIDSKNIKAPNLIIRISAHMIGKSAPNMGLPTSTVDAGIGQKCLAPKQDNQCLKCRACWKADNVDYTKH